MKEPLNHLEDCSGIQYRLQLNAYKFMLEKYYHAEVAEMYVVGAHPDNEEEVFVDRVPVMEAEVSGMMAYQRARARETSAMEAEDSSRDPLGGGADDPEATQGRDMDEDDREEEEAPMSQTSNSKRRRLTRKTSEPAGFTDSATPLPGAASSSDAPCGAAPDAAAQPAQEDLDYMFGIEDVADALRSADDAAVEATCAASFDATTAVIAAVEAAPAGSCDADRALVPVAEATPAASSAVTRSRQSFQNFFDGVSSNFDTLQASLEKDIETSDTIIAQAEAFQKLVQDRRPNWPARVKHLAVGALYTASLRLVDQGMREHVSLLYIIEGNTFLRAHAGTCYFYNNGAFKAFTGVPPQGVLERVKQFCLELEGMFRCFKPDTERCIGDDLLNAIDVLIAMSGGIENCVNKWRSKALQFVAPTARIAAMPQADNDPRDDAAADVQSGGKKFSWTSSQAWAMSRAGTSLQRELLSKAVIIHFTEWCETPCPAAPCVCVHDACFQFDLGEKAMYQVAKSPSNNCYISLPVKLVASGLSDSVVKEARRRLEMFFRTTFWKNEESKPIRVWGVNPLTQST